MSMDRDDLRYLFAKARAANLVGIPSTQELIKLEEHFLKILPEGWDRETLGSAFYAHCRTARGKFFFHPHELVQALQAESAPGTGGNWGKPSAEGCEICVQHGKGDGWLPVVCPSPSTKPSFNYAGTPRIVEGVMRCFCRPDRDGAESTVAIWLEGWHEHMEWHRNAIDCVPFQKERDHQWRLFDAQRALADRIFGIQNTHTSDRFCDV